MTQETLEVEAILSAVRDSADNLLVEAVAGSGKTTTMCKVARAVGPGRSIVALAFNKEAEVALTAKMPYFVQSSTFHAFCFAALAKHIGARPKPDGGRCRTILKELVPNWKERREVEDAVLTLVSRFKSTTLDHADEDALFEVADRFDIDAGTFVCGLAHDILERCLDPESFRKSVDFDDMLWLSLKLGVTFPPVSLLLLDEAQDTNGVQRVLLARMLELPQSLYDRGVHNHVAKPRLLAVGDTHQAIYAFRGADANAMDALRRDFAMRTLPLSVSWRCSQAVVKEAQKYL